MRALSDDGGGGELASVFDSYWPAYRKWIARSPFKDTGACVRRLREHMPQLVGVFETLVERFGGSDDVARFLTLWNPPPVVRGCSQLIADGPDGSELIRTYDHHPDLFDGLVLASSWGGVRALCVTDCLWGALDGINEHGLSVALAFGGRRATGDGFAAPLIVRYLLQTCETVAQARKALRRLPVSMAYTFVVLDASGGFITAYLGPDRTARFVGRRASSNHQGRVEWKQYGDHVQSAERLAALEALLDRGADDDAVESAFLAPPIWRRNYKKGAGSLYLARYTPSARRMRLTWPDTSREWRVGEEIDESFEVELTGQLSLK